MSEETSGLDRALADQDPLVPGRLTAAEAAARLGVKRQTLYAYVSRGLIAREVGLDGRSSLFDAAEIEAFRSGRRPAAEGELNTVITTAITRVGDDGLWIRGRDLVRLATDGTSFDEVVNLLWQSTPPERWAADSTLLTAVREVRDAAPESTGVLDAIRLAVVVASAVDPLRHELSGRAVRAAGRAAILAMVHGLPATEPVTDGPLADRIWRALAQRRGRPAERRALNAALCLLVDHGLAASNFSARIAGSVRSDPYSVLLSGLGPVGGTLHGAASAAVHELLADAESRDDAAAAVGEARRRLGFTPGFGHRVYTTQDPRYGALMAMVTDAWASDRRLGIVHRVRDVIAERSEDIPNVDLALGSLTWLARMPADAGEAIFAIARSAGWLAHATEEYLEEPIRFRPTARYVGPRPETLR